MRPPPGPSIPGMGVFGPVGSLQHARRAVALGLVEGDDEHAAVGVGGERRICGTHSRRNCRSPAEPPGPPSAHVRVVAVVAEVGGDEREVGRASPRWPGRRRARPADDVRVAARRSSMIEWK